MTAWKPMTAGFLGSVLALVLLAGGSASATTYPSISPWGLVTYFYGVGTVPGLDYDAVVSDQPIDLDGASFNAFGYSDDLCRVVPALQTGLTYTLLSTTGGLSGRLSYADGQPIADGDLFRGLSVIGRSCMHTIGSLELHYHESGPVQTVTATVVDGSPIPVTTTHLTRGGPAETNEPVTLAATVHPSSGPVSGTVSFSDFLALQQGPLCADVPVELVDGEYTATCEARLGAHEGAYPGWDGNLHASFVAGDASALAGSSTSTWDMVTRGQTTTDLEIEQSAAGTTIATATVAPGYAGPFSPTGSVRFRADGALVQDCDAQPLAGDGAPTATCDLSSLAPGEHAITAAYPGDENFVASVTPIAHVANVSAPAAVPAPPAPVAGTPVLPVALPGAAVEQPGRTAAKPRRRVVRRAHCHRRLRRAHRRAHAARVHRCTTIHRRKHTRGAGRRAG